MTHEQWCFLHDVESYIYQKSKSDHISRAIAGQIGIRLRNYIKDNPDCEKTRLAKELLEKAKVSL